MAFSDFKTIPEVQEKFRITYAENDFFAIEEPVICPSEQFLKEFEFSGDTLMFSHPRQHAVKQLSFLF